MDVPTDVEVSSHPHGAAAKTRSAAVVAAREAQHGVGLHEAVSPHKNAGIVQGPPHGDHREVPVEVDRRLDVKVFLQEERDACGEPRRVVFVKTGKRHP